MAKSELNDSSHKVRRLVVILGDQLNRTAAVFDGIDKQRDVIWMAEVASEATHVWTHKARIAYFLAAMRHFRDELIDLDYSVDYTELTDNDNQQSLRAELARAIKKHNPSEVVVVKPGEYRVLNDLRQAVDEQQAELHVLPDRHFMCSEEEFAEHAEGRKQLRLEYFYREMRKRYDVLMDGQQPIGGQWNFDTDNRGSFGKSGPGTLREPTRCRPDETTQAVLALVNQRFADHPGQLDEFPWPVSRREARRCLQDFIDHRLARFGEYQDAMWTEEPWLYHSRLSAAMNLKLLDPREVIEAACAAYHAESLPLASVEGFVRQILGWREYVRGIYWLTMPDYLERNALEADEPLPNFYWTGETPMVCLHDCIGQTLQHGYAHHIQRLMVTGLFALLLGVRPQAVHAWYLAVYVDAVEWVELPNTLGMSQYADGGLMASKPYAATGKYIQRMSNYCDTCRFDPAKAVGDDACPFTTLYWDFLARHKKRLQDNRRMALQVKNLDRKSRDEMKQIRGQADALRRKYAGNDEDA